MNPGVDKEGTCSACGKEGEKHKGKGRKIEWLGCDRCGRWVVRGCGEENAVMVEQWKCEVCFKTQRGLERLVAAVGNPETGWEKMREDMGEMKKQMEAVKVEMRQMQAGVRSKQVEKEKEMESLLREADRRVVELGELTRLKDQEITNLVKEKDKLNKMVESQRVRAVQIDQQMAALKETGRKADNEQSVIASFQQEREQERERFQIRIQELEAELREKLQEPIELLGMDTAENWGDEDEDKYDEDKWEIWDPEKHGMASLGRQETGAEVEEKGVEAEVVEHLRRRGHRSRSVTRSSQEDNKRRRMSQSEDHVYSDVGRQMNCRGSEVKQDPVNRHKILFVGSSLLLGLVRDSGLEAAALERDWELRLHRGGTIETVEASLRDRDELKLLQECKWMVLLAGGNNLSNLQKVSRDLDGAQRQRREDEEIVELGRTA